MGVRALLLLPSMDLTLVQGDLCCPPGVWPPFPDRCEEERDEHGEVVAPEPAVLITLFSGVCRPMADRILFPFMPVMGAQATSVCIEMPASMERVSSKLVPALDWSGEQPPDLLLKEVKRC